MNVDEANVSHCLNITFQGSPVEVLASLLVPPVTPEIEVSHEISHVSHVTPVIELSPLSSHTFDILHVTGNPQIGESSHI